MISKAQQQVIDLLMRSEAPFHFIPWGLNYFQLWDANHDYMQRVRHCVFDALVRKNLIHYDDGWWLNEDN